MDKYIIDVKNDLLESVNFFGNKQKADRELWVVNEFISYLNIEYNRSEIQKGTIEPIDASFRDVGFQVKEVLDKDRRRGDEYKDNLEEITEKTKPEDLLKEYNHTHIPLNDSLPYVASEIKRHRIEKYKNNVGSINLLLYLNLKDTTYTTAEVNFSLLSEELNKWKSISLVANNCAIVLACNDENISLLNSQLGKLCIKN